ncbi:hypothetical protein F4780DRAFT_736718 [Xylariomycetidae sp. FL0641]|nr:hypothetical protein F4780DRAFT_736718 [Xylariomycetidae sp. FL0641]
MAPSSELGLGMESLRIAPSSTLDTLPTDILLIILSYLDTARSVANLASTCKGLNHLVSSNGWRIFVTTCFSSLSLPYTDREEDWRGLARSLTSQARDWDRRAFVFHSLTPPEKRRPNGRRYHPGNSTQSIPGNIIVDAHAQRRGRHEEEMVVWGSGEDVVARVRQRHGTKIESEVWHSHKGSHSGYHAGKDDTTAISLLKRSEPRDDDLPQAVVGRANGDLRLLSMAEVDFGQTLSRFRPSSAEERPLEQREISSFDFCERTSLLAAATRENLVLYPLDGPEDAKSLEGDREGRIIQPSNFLALKNAAGSTPFEFIRSVKFISQENIAIALNKSFNPIQYVTMTPSGMEVSSAAKVTDQYVTLESDPRTVRAMLPVNMQSVAGGHGNSLLSTWDDGTIRLQDLRTPSPFDRIFQDNFEVTTPLNALVSHGVERFLAGSAHSHMLKVFDFRWPKGYYHTEALPCGNDRPYPMPRPPTIVPEPVFKDNRTKCDYVGGHSCRWHALSRHDFYRPNCNVYLPFKNYASSPIYSLAKPSDTSPTIFAGLSGMLVEVTLKSGVSQVPPTSSEPLYSRQKGKVAILETGDGSPIVDITKCQRVPEIRRQSFSGLDSYYEARQRHRLDESLQNPSELRGPQPSTDGVTG